MANYLGINRSVLSHELKKMEKEGILKVRKNILSWLIKNKTEFLLKIRKVVGFYQNIVYNEKRIRRQGGSLWHRQKIIQKF